MAIFLGHLSQHPESSGEGRREIFPSGGSVWGELESRRRCIISSPGRRPRRWTRQPVSPFFQRCSWTEGLLGAAMLNRCDGGQICTTSSSKTRNAPKGMLGKGWVQLQAMYKYLHCVRGAYRSLKPKDCGANHSSALLHLQKRICASCVTASSVGLEVRQQGGVAPRPCKNKDQRTATSRRLSCIVRRPISLISTTQGPQLCLCYVWLVDESTPRLSARTPCQSVADGDQRRPQKIITAVG
ncbi:hypothetical protein V8C44DRAFT_50888 [Trichoderma aethiopicum]